jgi:hypothetical protein
MFPSPRRLGHGPLVPHDDTPSDGLVGALRIDGEARSYDLVARRAPAPTRSACRKATERGDKLG